MTKEGVIHLEHLLTKIVDGFHEELSEDFKLVKCQSLKFIIENVGCLAMEFKSLLGASSLGDKYERESMEKHRKQILLEASLMKMDERLQCLMMEIDIMETAPKGFWGIYAIPDRRATLLKTFEAWKVAVKTKKESLGAQLTEWDGALDEMAKRINRPPLSAKEIANMISFLQENFDAHYATIKLLTTAIADAVKNPACTRPKGYQKGYGAAGSNRGRIPTKDPETEVYGAARLPGRKGVPAYVGNLHEELLFLAEKEVQHEAEVPLPRSPTGSSESDADASLTADSDPWKDERNVNFSPTSLGDELS
ncbi:hypothetical protein MLD38_032044 [Melastoma candidum]|uniref:Uncharacterized protein n=1 Tax=Melastoma candidum TaxID=119954 RepID=A0ACB9MT95_9MYRT|nr:hypothetical protein MLD38_032044 [Melastoma candidum]